MRISTLVILFAIVSGCIFEGVAQTVPPASAFEDWAKLEDFAGKLTGGQDRLLKKIDVFSQKTGLPLYIITAYKPNQVDLNRLAGEWPQKGKGLLLALNLHEETNWQENFKIAYTPDVVNKISADRIGQVREWVAIPLLEGQTIKVSNEYGSATSVSYAGQGKYSLTLEQTIHALIEAFEGKNLNNPTAVLPIITFRENTVTGAGAVYGFDEKTSDALASHYQKGIHEVTKAEEYIPWKSVALHGNDVVTTKVSSSDIADLTRFSFPTSSGISLPHPRKLDETSLQITVLGEASEGVQSVSAYYSTSDSSGHTLARLNVITYPKVFNNLVIVPLAGTANVPDAKQIQDTLNKIFGQAVAEWDVTMADPFSPGDWDSNRNGKIESGNSGLLSNYPAEMRKINRAFKNNDPGFDQNTYYLFLANEAEGAGMVGYMPRAKQFGYVFTKNQSHSNLLRTIAHELGHGTFHLKHTFDETSLARGSTNNLMDYGTGKKLHKYQWDYIHDPVTVIGLLEEDEDAQLAVVTDLAQLKSFANPDGSLTFMSPAGLPITLPANTQSVTFATGERWLSN